MKPVDYTAVTRRVTRTTTDIEESPFVKEFVTTLLTGEEVHLEIEDNLNLFKDTPHEETIYFRKDDVFYELSRETLEEGTVTGPNYKVSRNGVTPEDLSEENILPMDDLPYYDQWRLYDVLHISDTGGITPFSDSFIAGYLNSDSHTESLLVNGVEQQFIEYNGQYIRLEEQGEGTASIDRVRFWAEPITENIDTFGKHIADQQALEATALSTDAQDLIRRLEENHSVAICTNVAGGESDEIEEADESEREAINELESLSENTTLSYVDAPSQTGKRILYIRHDGEEYEISWEHTTIAV